MLSEATEADWRSATMRGDHILLVGTGGSSGQTLALIEAAIAGIAPDTRFTFLDTQPFNLRTGGTTRYPGAGEVRMISPDACGLRSWTGSQTLNLALNGGPFAYRRMIARCRAAMAPQPDAVVICHDRIYVETAALEAARAGGTPTILLQEGPFCAIGNMQAQSRKLRLKAALAPLANRSGVLPPIPDYGMFGHDLVLAASPAYRQRWVEAGLPPSSVEVCGVPRFDRLHGAAAAPRQRNGAPLRLLYLTQPFAAHGKVSHEAAQAALQVMADGLNRARRELDLELVIRVHPRSAGEDVAQLRALLDFAASTDDGSTGIEQALAGADAAIGHYSTGLLEALLLNRPALCVPVASEGFAEAAEARKQVWLTTTGIPVARSADSFTAALRLIAAGQAMDGIDWGTVEEETGRADGLACETAARSILSVMDRRRAGLR